MEDRAGIQLNRRTFVGGSVALGGAIAASAAVAGSDRTAHDPGDSHTTVVRAQINGEQREIAVDNRTSLLDMLRERAGLPGTKKGCDQGACGACTVLVDGRRINSCLTLAVMHDGAHITTIEGLAEGGKLHPLQQAFIDEDAFQCGYCTSGQIMSALGCIAEGHTGSAAQIRESMSGNICRCGRTPTSSMPCRAWHEQTSPCTSSTTAKPPTSSRRYGPVRAALGTSPAGPPSST
ncbi:(2Fe-2S)-binding protein [Mycobacterium kubicae]|uniref:(2Fe-2S)-binding protein n=1 Tax=Mycobacterium kubicae TaxID=120959 RepID=UPI00146C0355|nr:(2Fe-2S)-binding protein [Mycobacterium kubicae]